LKQIFLISLAVLATFLFSGCDKLRPEEGHEFNSKEEEWLYRLSDESFGGRRVGTECNLLAYQYICSLIEGLGYSYETMEFEVDENTKARNITVTIPGTSEKSIIVGAHYDGAAESYSAHHFPAANDNASGVVTILSLLKTLKQNPAKTDHTIIFCFWDAEEVYNGGCYRGSMYFTQHHKRLKNTLVYINVDTIGHDHERQIRIYNDGTGTDEAVNLIAANKRFIYSLEGNKYSSGGSDFLPFSYAKVPFIAFRDITTQCNNPIHSIFDKAEEVSTDRILKVASNIKDIIENSYGRSE